MVLLTGPYPPGYHVTPTNVYLGMAFYLALIVIAIWAIVRFTKRYQ